MLGILGTGIGILILVITSILMTKREEPTGCIIYFGSIFLFIFLTLLIMPTVIQAG